MSLNFFKSECQSIPLVDSEFGLCDDQNGEKAYIDNSDRSKWIATVKNDALLSIVFTAVDKCVLFDHEYIGRGRCDGMLTTSRHLYLVELKDKDPPWQTDAIVQLESTIQFLMDNHDISAFKNRKIFASNKRRAKFVVLDNEFNISFFKRTTFRIDIQAENILIK